MAKLYFSYSAMNAGKSTLLLQASYNYGERGMKTLLFTAKLDNRSKSGEISSRIGLAEKAHTFEEKDNLFATIKKIIKVIIIDGMVVKAMYFICVNKSVPAIAGAKLVVSESGDILSPK